MDAKEFIQKLSLTPHPEGGWYRQVYGNDETDGDLTVHHLSANDEMQVVIEPEQWFAAEFFF